MQGKRLESNGQRQEEKRTDGLRSERYCTLKKMEGETTQSRAHTDAHSALPEGVQAAFVQIRLKCQITPVQKLIKQEKMGKDDNSHTHS